MGLTDILLVAFMHAEQPQFQDFEQFWLHFLTSHQNPATRWAHLAALVAGLGGATLAIALRKTWPVAVGAAAAAGLAALSHRLVEGNKPENLGRPLWAGRAFLRMCLRTATGTIDADMERALAQEKGNGE